MTHIDLCEVLSASLVGASAAGAAHGHPKARSHRRADLIIWSRAKPVDIYTTMRLGINYPLGSMASAEQIGVSRVAGVLSNTQGHYGAIRYHRALALSRRHVEGGRFHG